MLNLEFVVEMKHRGTFVHYTAATEVQPGSYDPNKLTLPNGVPIATPVDIKDDGNKALVGQYPTLEAHIAAVHGVSVGPLFFTPGNPATTRIDTLRGSTYTYNHGGHQTVVHDYKRVAGLWESHTVAPVGNN